MTPPASYFAGFFDADGYASIYRQRGNRLSLRVAVRQVKPEVLHYFARELGGRVRGPYRNGAHSNVYEWSVCGREAVRVAVLLEPHSIGKRCQLQIVKEFGTTLSPAGKRNRITAAVNSKRETCLVQMRKANERGFTG